MWDVVSSVVFIGERLKLQSVWDEIVTRIEMQSYQSLKTVADTVGTILQQRVKQCVSNPHAEAHKHCFLYGFIMDLIHQTGSRRLGLSGGWQTRRQLAVLFTVTFRGCKHYEDIMCVTDL